MSDFGTKTAEASFARTQREAMICRQKAIAFGVAALAAMGFACQHAHETGSMTPKVTLVGCLQPGDQPDTYRLANTAAPTGPVGTQGTAPMVGRDNATGTAASSHTSDLGVPDTRLYTLVGGKNVDLAPFQGTVVKVTGQLERAKRSNAGGATGGSTAGQNAQPDASGGNPTTGQGPQSSVYGPAPDRPDQTLRVSAVQRVAPDCATAR